MTYLLKSTSLFRRLPNCSYTQLAGKPIQLVLTTRNVPSLRFGNGSFDISLPSPVKRKRVDEEKPAQEVMEATNKGIGRAQKGASTKNSPRSPMDIPVPRYLIFFSQPTRSGSSQIKVGFPTSRKFLNVFHFHSPYPNHTLRCSECV